MDNQKPRLGSAAVVRKEDRILLGKRGKQPGFGKWVLPGGGVDFLESYKDTVKREVREETDLEVTVGDFIGIYEVIDPPDNHRVIIYSWAEYKGGEIRPSSDLLEAKFFTPDEVREIVRKEEDNDLLKRVLQDIGWL